MARILCVDYGMRRCGIASTDPLQIVVNGVATIEKKELVDFLKDYCDQEDVEKVIFGHPGLESGVQTPMIQSMEDVIKTLRKVLPNLEIDFHDESYTSHSASQVIFNSGLKKKKRRDKSLVDKISAVLILQDYLGHI